MLNLGHIDRKDLLEQELLEIEKWEKDQKDLWFWEKIARIPFAILDKITPKVVHKYLGKILDELGGYIQNGGKYLVSEKSILEKYSAKLHLPEEELQLQDISKISIKNMNELSESMKELYISTATLQGATTGIGGIFTLAIDIPLVLGMSLKVLQEMAICYGYDPNEKSERIFIVKCLQFASADYVGKKAILEDLIATTHNELDAERNSISQIQGWREVLMNYRDNYGWKKLFQVVPVIGIVFGALINRSTINDVAETGQMLYRKRRVLDKMANIKQAPPVTLDHFEL